MKSNKKGNLSKRYTFRQMIGTFILFLCFSTFHSLQAQIHRTPGTEITIAEGTVISFSGKPIEIQDVPKKQQETTHTVTQTDKKSIASADKKTPKEEPKEEEKQTSTFFFPKPTPSESFFSELRQNLCVVPTLKKQSQSAFENKTIANLVLIIRQSAPLYGSAPEYGSNDYQGKLYNRGSPFERLNFKA